MLAIHGVLVQFFGITGIDQIGYFVIPMNVSCTDKGCEWNVKNEERNTGMCIDELGGKSGKKEEEIVTEEQKQELGLRMHPLRQRR